MKLSKDAIIQLHEFAQLYREMVKQENTLIKNSAKVIGAYASLAWGFLKGQKKSPAPRTVDQNLAEMEEICAKFNTTFKAVDWIGIIIELGRKADQIQNDTHWSTSRCATTMHAMRIHLLRMFLSKDEDFKQEYTKSIVEFVSALHLVNNAREEAELNKPVNLHVSETDLDKVNKHIDDTNKHLRALFYLGWGWDLLGNALQKVNHELSPARLLPEFIEKLYPRTHFDYPQGYAELDERVNPFFPLVLQPSFDQIFLKRYRHQISHKSSLNLQHSHTDDEKSDDKSMHSSPVSTKDLMNALHSPIDSSSADHASSETRSEQKPVSANTGIVTIEQLKKLKQRPHSTRAPTEGSAISAERSLTR